MIKLHDKYFKPFLSEEQILNAVRAVADKIAMGYAVKKELSQPIIYKDITLDHGYRIDLLVKNTIVIELKTVEKFTNVHSAQILTYMRLGNYPIGLLLNFKTKLLKNGIKRFVNDID